MRGYGLNYVSPEYMKAYSSAVLGSQSEVLPVVKA